MVAILTGPEKKQSDFICLWCGCKTTAEKDKSALEIKYSNKEHVFPESIGGNEKLKAGDVCEDCNNKLSFLDNCLKKGNDMMMFSLQGDRFIKGKKTSNKKRKIRRQAERKEITGSDGYSKITRDLEKNKTVILNSAPEKYDGNFCKSIHKCLANIICFEKGSLFVRKNYPELINFVLNGNNTSAWSFAVSYQGYLQVLSILPKTITFTERPYSHDRLDTVFVAFIHTSGIWIVCSHPNSMDAVIIEQFSKKIVSDDSPSKEQLKGDGRRIEDVFRSQVMTGKSRTLIGDLNFLWIKKNIVGKPNSNDTFYLLTRCKICGQTNPTGYFAKKTEVIIKNEFNGKQYEKNTWNSYTKQDLVNRGFITKNWKEENWNRQLRVGITTPTTFDIKSIIIKKNTITCLNCDNSIEFESSDCFL